VGQQIMAADTEGQLRMLPALGGSQPRRESHATQKARRRVAESTTPT